MSLDNKRTMLVRSVLATLMLVALVAWFVFIGFKEWQFKRGTWTPFDTNSPSYVDYIGVDTDGNWIFGPIASRNFLSITNGLTNSVTRGWALLPPRQEERP